MSILKSLGLSKDTITRLLGIKPQPEPPKNTLSVKRKLGRPKGRKIAKTVVEKIRQAHPTYTINELSKIHGVSPYWVWCIRKGNARKKA